MSSRDEREPWWWGFRMPVWQRFLVTLMCLVVLFVMERADAPLWLGVPVALVLVVCLPGVVEVVRKGLGGNQR